MANTKLNPKGKLAVKSIRKVAAKRGEKVALSKNGNLQFVKEPLQRLYELTVCTLFGKDTFYRTSDQLVKDMKKELKAAVGADQLDFVANVAVHARTVMGIRTMPLVLVVEFARELREQKKQYDNMRRLVCDVIQRADQITDMYAYALEVFGDKGKVPMAIKRGVGDAMNKFNEYHYGKYNRDGGVKFRDVLRIVHPDAKDVKQGFIFEKIMKDTLATPYTWEVELSKNGQLPLGERKSDKEVWTELLTSGKLGYMALLRNLRNICEAQVDKSVMKAHVIDVLRDPKRVAQSKQFPFAFVQALRAVESIAPQGLKSALSDALELSCGNIPQLGDDVVLLVDSSGSMQGGYQFNARGESVSTASPADNAAVLSAALVKANRDAYNLHIIYFDSSAREVSVDPGARVMENATKLRALSRGGATRLSAAFKLMKSKNLNPDTLIVLSDMEVNHCGTYERPDVIFRNKKCIKVAINFNGSNTTPLSVNDGWYQMAGWSDKMFKFIPAMRESITVVDALSVSYIGAEAMKAELLNGDTE